MARKSNIKATLGVRATQTSTLTTRHQNHRNLVLRNRLETCIVPLLDILGIRVQNRGESGVWEGFERGRALLGCFRGGGTQGNLSQFVDTGGFEVGELMVELSLFGRFEFIDKSKYLALSGIGILLLERLELFCGWFTEGRFRLGVSQAHEVRDRLLDSSSHFLTMRCGIPEDSKKRDRGGERRRRRGKEEKEWRGPRGEAVL